MASLLKSTLLLLAGLPFTFSIPTPRASLDARSNTSTSSSLVFAHYMVITRPPNGDYTEDINLAISAGISAFAVNYGGSGVSFDDQTSYLNEMYTAVTDMLNDDPSLDFRLFISIDTTSVTDASLVVDLYNKFATSSAQLLIDGKPALSSFSSGTPAFNWQTEVIDHLSTAPFFLPGTLEAITDLVQNAENLLSQVIPVSMISLLNRELVRADLSDDSYKFRSDGG